MRKKIILILVLCCVFLFYGIIDHLSYKPNKMSVVREKYDVLNADEVFTGEKADNYEFDVTTFINGESEQKDAVLSLIKEIADDAGMDAEYISAKPIYCWDADKNEIVDTKCLIAFFDSSRENMELCELTLNSKRQVVDENYEENGFSHTIESSQEEMIYVTAANEDGTVVEDVLINSRNTVITPNNGYYSFQITVKGDYFGKLKEFNNLVFSNDELKNEKNLIKIK